MLPAASRVAATSRARSRYDVVAGGVATIGSLEQARPLPGAGRHTEHLLPGTERIGMVTNARHPIDKPPKSGGHSRRRRGMWE